MTVSIKICGLSTPGTLDAALGVGADLVGFVRYARSPRHVGLEQGRALSRQARGRALRVALLVDPDDAALAETVEALDPDLLQLHGHETPERVAAVRARFGPVIKAIGIAATADLAAVEPYTDVADRILLDAKPPRDSRALPGGNGLSFDWRILAPLDLDERFMLSGGLTAETVAAAVALTGVHAVDVSSGVEKGPGVKDSARIEAFVRAARSAISSKQEVA